MIQTLRCGLIGSNLGKSRFSAGLDLMCRAHDITLDFQLVDTATRPGFDFTSQVETCQAGGWAGTNVTHPYKTDAARWLGQALSPEMTRLGACNMIVFDEGGPRGHNTDYEGFVSAWRATMGHAKPGRVAMAGAGGVARALGVALADLGAEDIVIWDRDLALARTLAQQIGPQARAIPIDDAPATLETAQGLVNATPLGMHAYPGSAFPLPLSGKPEWAFDAVYTPVETPFLKSAHAAGAQVLTGFDLFRHMALCSFTAYTGLTPDPQTTLAQLDALKPEE